MATRKPHKTMTPEEYAAMPIIGWHEVCRDVDGFGGVGVRFLGEAGPVVECDMQVTDRLAREIIEYAFENDVLTHHGMAGVREKIAVALKAEFERGNNAAR